MTSVPSYSDTNIEAIKFHTNIFTDIVMLPVHCRIDQIDNVKFLKSIHFCFVYICPFLLCHYLVMLCERHIKHEDIRH